jgi:hypothetical protein
MNYVQLVNEIQTYTENQFDTNDINTFIDQAEQRIYNTVQLPALRKNVTGTITAGNKYLAIPVDWLSTFSLAVINSANEYTYLLNKDVNFIRQSFPDTDSDFYGEPQYYAVFNNTSFILGPTPDIGYSAELHYFYYPESIIQGTLGGFGPITGGSLYTDGYYYNVSLGGSGTGVNATANFIVSGGAVTTMTIVNPGCLYQVGDTLTVNSADIGGTGSGFAITVTSVGNSTGSSWLGNNFSSALLYGALLEAYTYMKGEQDVLANYKNRYDEAMLLLKQLGDGKDRGDAYRDGQVKYPVQ